MSKRGHFEETGILPEGYRQLEYIESTGTQYIDTGVSCTPSLRVVIDIAWTQIASNLSNGVQDWNIGIIFRIDQFPLPNGVYAYYGNHSGTFQAPSGIGGDNLFHHIDYENGKQSVDGVTFSHLTMTNSSNKSFFLFAVNSVNSQVTFKSKQKLSKCEMLFNGSHIRLLKPALRISDNKPGLYDLCGSICPLTGTPFYINSGTGEFLYN